MQLLPERAGCPQCGSTSGKRWRSYSGIELCTDCEWDFLSMLNERKLLDAQHAIEPKTSPKASRPPSQVRHKSAGTNPTSGTSKRPWGGDSDALGRGLGYRTAHVRPEDDPRCKVKYRELLQKLVTPGYNSLCLLCGRLFYGAAMSSCSRCGGLCRTVSDHDMQLMGRHGQRLVEAEK